MEVTDHQDTPTDTEISLEGRIKWPSQGSGLEVISERACDTRDKVEYILKRQLKNFGKPITFSDSTSAHNKKTSADFAPCEDKAFSIRIKQLNKSCQVVRYFRDVVCETDTPQRKNIWTQYQPREFSTQKQDEILQSEGMLQFLQNTVPRLFDAMEQSEIVDVFKDDFQFLH